MEAAGEAAQGSETWSLGLTGGIGCGKSTALRYFAEFGAQTLETDFIVKELLSKDGEVKLEIEEAYGKGILNGEGKIDRKKLGAIVFEDSKKLKQLESILHPRVRERWTQALKSGHPLVVVEIPLLFEKQLETEFDRTICVTADSEMQKMRLKARGLTETDITQRKQNQMSLNEKMKRADILLYNNGEPEHLRDQISLLMRALREPSVPFLFP